MAVTSIFTNARRVGRVLRAACIRRRLAQLARHDAAARQHLRLEQAYAEQLERDVAAWMAGNARERMRLGVELARLEMGAS